MSRRRSKFAPKEHLQLEELMPNDEELAALNVSAVTPERSVLRKESASRIRKALEAIPPQYRLILVLHDMEELGTAEVAKITGLREGTVRAKPRRCRKIFAALSDFLDETLDQDMCEELEKHLEGCQPCEAFLSDLERTVERCRSYDPECKSIKNSAMRKKVAEEYRRVLTALKKSIPVRA
jgi:RNA polymerase sigma-70 factor (ECF subfamily)